MRPSPDVAAVLSDLITWAGDIAIRLTRGCLEEREAIERVRCYALAWLAGKPWPEVSVEDVLTTTAALMSGIDRRVVLLTSKRRAGAAAVCA